MTFILISLICIAMVLAILLPSLLRPYHADGETNSNHQQVYRQQLAELALDKQNGVLNADDYHLAKADLARRVLEEVNHAQPMNQHQADRPLAAILLISLPILAALLYWQFGTPMAVTQAEMLLAKQPSTNQAMQQAGFMKQVLPMVASLEAKLKAKPNNPEGWALLAKSYNELERYEDAAAAYDKAVQLNPKNANVLADYADILAFMQQGDFTGIPETLVDQALAIDQNHIKALMMATTIAFNANDYAKATVYLEQLIEQLPSDSPKLATIKASLENVKRLSRQ